jgi:hypothetical protein
MEINVLDAQILHIMTRRNYNALSARMEKFIINQREYANAENKNQFGLELIV